MMRLLKCLALVSWVGFLSSLAAEPRPAVIVPSTAAHPRNDSASIVELADGRLFMGWIEFIRSELGGHDGLVVEQKHVAFASIRILKKTHVVGQLLQGCVADEITIACGKGEPHRRLCLDVTAEALILLLPLEGRGL